MFKLVFLIITYIVLIWDTQRLYVYVLFTKCYANLTHHTTQIKFRINTKPHQTNFVFVILC